MRLLSLKFLMPAMRSLLDFFEVAIAFLGVEGGDRRLIFVEGRSLYLMLGFIKVNILILTN